MIAEAGVDDETSDLRWWCWPWSSVWHCSSINISTGLVIAESRVHWSERSSPPSYFSSVSAHWYSQLLGNLMGFYLNWNCPIYKLIYFLILKITLTRHQTINQEWESAHISTACEQQQKKMSRLKNIPGNSRDISITKIPPVQT